MMDLIWRRVIDQTASYSWGGGYFFDEKLGLPFLLLEAIKRSFVQFTNFSKRIFQLLDSNVSVNAHVTYFPKFLKRIRICLRRRLGEASFIISKGISLHLFLFPSGTRKGPFHWSAAFFPVTIWEKSLNRFQSNISQNFFPRRRTPSVPRSDGFAADNKNIWDFWVETYACCYCIEADWAKRLSVKKTPGYPSEQCSS